MGEEGTEKPQILVTLGLSSISGQWQHCQIWAGSWICVCISQILGTLGIICIVQGVKTELSWLFFAAVQKRLHKGTTRQWGQREHQELHWNMIVRTNPSCQCANHAGKCKIDPRSLMIPAAIHGKGTRDWDMPLLLCPARGQDVPHWSFVEEQHHFHCSGLYLVGDEQDCDSLWAGKEWDRDVLQQAQGKGWLSQKVGIAPIPPAMPSLGLAKDQQRPQRTVMVLTSTPKGKLLRAPKGQRVALLKIQMTQLWSESFYFCLLASVIWFPSYSLNHSEICFCRQGQLCHSCFPNFKLEYIH